MNYRFLHFTSSYPPFIQSVLASFPDCTACSYKELYEAIMQARFGWSDYFVRHMVALGNEAIVFDASVEALQKVWAREQGISYREERWQAEIVLAQVKSYRPDIIFLDDLSLFNVSLRRQLREACDWPVKVIGWRAAPTEDFSAFRDLDLVLTAALHFINRLTEGGVSAEYLPLAFEHSLAEEIPPLKRRDLDFTFIGSIGSENGVHSSRYRHIAYLMKKTPLEVWTIQEGLERNSKKKLISKKERLGKVSLLKIFTRGFWEEIGLSPQVRADISMSEKSLLHGYRERIHSPVFGREAFEIIGRSKVTFNCHIDVAEDYAGNMRLYEATGMGACLVTDWKKNIRDLFDPDNEIIVYHTAEEAAEKVLYLLEHDAQRQAIATAGQKRTLRDHTYQKRIEVLNHLILRALRSD